MHFKDIIKQVAENNNISAALCGRVLKDAFRVISEKVMEDGEKISIKGIGAFYLGTIAARKMAKAMGGYKSPGYSILKFRASKLLRK